MGFRCPICHKDFGKDKKALLKHSEKCALGGARVVIDSVEAKGESFAGKFESHKMDNLIQTLGKYGFQLISIDESKKGSK